MGSVPGLGRSPGEGNGNPHIQYSCWENPMDRGVLCATVHGVARSQTPLSTHSLTHSMNKNIWRKRQTQCEQVIGRKEHEPGDHKLNRGGMWHGSWISDTEDAEGCLESKPRARMQSPENWAEILVSCWPDSHTGYTQSLLSCREAVWKKEL